MVYYLNVNVINNFGGKYYENICQKIVINIDWHSSNAWHLNGNDYHSQSRCC